MAHIALELPTIQNWSCHNCGGCCRQHAIYITDAERERITAQGWHDLPGWPVERGVIVREGSRQRLATREDGACIFLDEQGLCRIHARFGEPAKPLACRVYPYAFHPAGAGLTVSLRFSCPSVARNLGRPVTEQVTDLQALAQAVLPANYAGMAPPELARGQRVTWERLLEGVDALDGMLSVPHVPLGVRLQRIAVWTGLMEQAPLAALREEQLAALIELLYAESEARVSSERAAIPSGMGLRLFRLAVGQYVRHDTFARKPTWRDRWDFVWWGVRFARGKGLTPTPHPRLKAVAFTDLAGTFGLVTPEMEALLTRYLRVKVQGLHLCGRAAYGESLFDGIRSLLLVISVVLYVTKWIASSGGRIQWTLDDLVEAMTIVDHNHAYSPALGTSSSLGRVRLLNTTGDLPRLLNWCGL
ncbi:MAG: YkgJ family cysteine cluster protein [Planctomycetota bacterium]|nr:MAG: YkgJ family cysteine cluster protein [Planctomycetota bacterium]